MPVIKQAIKKVRQDKRKTEINLATKNKYKKAIAAFKKNPTEALLKTVYNTLDRAAKAKIIHPNKAARLKSRLSKKVTGASKKSTPSK